MGYILSRPFEQDEFTQIGENFRGNSGKYLRSYAVE
jgi:hypothetical protein